MRFFVQDWREIVSARWEKANVKERASDGDDDDDAAATASGVATPPGANYKIHRRIRLR